MNDNKISVTVHFGNEGSHEAKIQLNMTMKQVKIHIKGLNLFDLSGIDLSSLKTSIGNKLHNGEVLAKGTFLKDEEKVRDLDLEDGGHLIMKEDNEPDYASGESEFDNTRIEFNSLKQSELQEHLKELWRLCFLKSLGAS